MNFLILFYYKYRLFLFIKKRNLYLVNQKYNWITKIEIMENYKKNEKI